MQPILGVGKELGENHRRLTSADIAGLCCPRDFLRFSCEQYSLIRSLHLTDTEPYDVLLSNSRNLI